MERRRKTVAVLEGDSPSNISWPFLGQNTPFFLYGPQFHDAADTTRTVWDGKGSQGAWEAQSSDRREVVMARVESYAKINSTQMAKENPVEIDILWW